MLKCGLYQNKVNLQEKLVKWFAPEKIEFHHFLTLSAIFENPQKLDLDLIVFASGSNLKEEINSLKKVRKNLLLSLTPVVFFHPRPSAKLLQESYKASVDEFLFSSEESGLVSYKLKNLISRSQKHIGVNPSTKLPGTHLIEIEINRRISKKEKFALGYADLDDFKAYNDYYGYFYGDKLIRLTAEIIRDVVTDLAPKSFVGHIGGDDFIFLIPIDKIDTVCKNIIKVFDQMVPSRYEEKDLMRGYIQTQNRDGAQQKFPLMTISIAIMRNSGNSFSHLGEISHMLADLKKYTKSLTGSNYVVERRRKY